MWLIFVASTLFKMHVNLSLVALITIFFLSVQASRSYTLIPLTTTLTAEQKRKIESQENLKDNNYNTQHRSMYFYSDFPELRLHAVKYAWNQSSNKKHVFFSYYGDHYLTYNDDEEVISFFSNSDINFDFNTYGSPNSEFKSALYHRSGFYKGTSQFYDLNNMTILQTAVMNNKPELVKHILSLDLGIRLRVEKSMQHRPFVTARIMARKITNESDRKRMLEVLIIDKSKHEMSNISTILKEALGFSVKESVIDNNLAMMESALLLGNHGDKTDESIVRYAVNHKNSLMIEALVLEGYAIPTLTPAEWEGMESYIVTFLRTNINGTSRVPYPQRDYYEFFGYGYFNDYCF